MLPLRAARSTLRLRPSPRVALSRTPLPTRPPLNLSYALQARFASSSSSPRPAPGQPPRLEKKGLKISHLFGGLVGLGMLVTIYGLLEWYYSLQIWPEPVRSPLKSAIKAKNQGDIEKADKWFQVAVAAARTIPPSELGEEYLLMLSGVYVTWSAMLEEHATPVRAYVALRDGIAFFGPDPTSAEPVTTASQALWEGDAPRPLNAEEKIRAIGLAQKLGQLASRMGEMAIPPPYPLFKPQPPAVFTSPNVAPKPRREGEQEEAEEERPVLVAPVPAGLGSNANGWDEAAEIYLHAALGAMMRIGLKKHAEGPVVVGRDISLPHDEDSLDNDGRVNRRGLGMTMEALADVYARQKRYDLAAQLLVQAVSTVIPPQENNPSAEDRCQAAMLMTGISSHALDAGTKDAVKVSRSWSLKALQIANDTVKEAGWAGLPEDQAHATCVRAKTAAQFNLGMLEEIEKHPEAAAKYFAAALATARDGAYTDGKREASEALRRVKALIADKS